MHPDSLEETEEQRERTADAGPLDGLESQWWSNKGGPVPCRVDNWVPLGAFRVDWMMSSHV
ncbi:hypothetical protein F1880_001220 [Penicillium rolfsii]|nr:hypothetical protein F1880_001220 [Penicillium rolfsii]